MSPEFDSIARGYDAEFSHTLLGKLLRQRVHTIMQERGMLQNAQKEANLYPISPSVLELNAGTGEDALWLAQQGWDVLATDISAEMLAVAEQKARPYPTLSLSFQVCPFSHIGDLEAGQFDLIFSNFGGLNCISPEELARLGPIIAQKLKPGGRFIAVVMGPFCAWETLYFLAKASPKKAFRRLRNTPLPAQLDAQTNVDTWYHSPRLFQKMAVFNQKKTQIEPIGLWLPPSYLNPFFEKRPRMLQFFQKMEQCCTPHWMAQAADHYLICLEKNGSPDMTSAEVKYGYLEYR